MGAAAIGPARRLFNRRLLARRPLLVTVPTVGIAVSDLFTAVCLEGPPARITGMYRSRLSGFDSESRAEVLLAAATEAFHVIRAPTGVPTVLALEPAATTIDLPLIDGWSPTPVEAMVDDDLVLALEGAGFTLSRFDALPVALARFAWSSIEHWGHVAACGWSVEVTGDRLVAWGNQPAGWQSADRFDRQPLLAQVAVPRSIGRHLNPEFDAGAIGAALRSHGHNPDAIVQVGRTIGPTATVRP